jgi:hypothetical protein
MKRTSVFSCAVLAVCVSSGCVDLSPLPFSEPDAADASAGDAPLDVANLDALVAGCRQCLSSGPCAPALNACDTDMTCAAFADCMTSSLCWASSLTDLMHLTPCLVNCATTGGITSQNSPGALLIGPLFTCAQDPARCGNECAPSTDQ